MIDGLRNIVNASGFAFQLAVERAVGRTSWRSLAHEIPWLDEAVGEQKFADLLLQRYDRDRLVIECKRTTDAHWVFLAPARTQARTKGIVCQWGEWTHVCGALGGWDEVAYGPESPVSEFCAIRGSDDRDRGLLERLASPLARAAESLAALELEQMRATEHDGTRVYIPMIVTNARLHVCRFDEADVDMASGKLPDTLGDFEEVPLVRFTKSLAGSVACRDPRKPLDTHLRESLRTVLVASSLRLVETLEAWGLHSDECQCPWYLARLRRSRGLPAA